MKSLVKSEGKSLKDLQILNSNKLLKSCFTP